MSKDKIIEAEEVKSAKLDNTIDPEMIVMKNLSNVQISSCNFSMKLLIHFHMQLF